MELTKQNQEIVKQKDKAINELREAIELLKNQIANKDQIIEEINTSFDKVKKVNQEQNKKISSLSQEKYDLICINYRNI